MKEERETEIVLQENYNDDGLKGFHLTPKSIAHKPMNYSDVDYSDFTLNALKVIDLYASRINPKAPDNDRVCFTKEELANCLGVGRILDEQIESIMDDLTHNNIIYHDYRTGEALQGTLFLRSALPIHMGTSKAYQLKATLDLGHTYFFELGVNNPYFKTRIQALMKIQSKYSYLLAMYLSQQDSIHRKTWTVDLEELRKILCCKTYVNENSEVNIKEFNQKVVKPSFAEVNALLDISVAYKYHAGVYTIKILERLPEHRRTETESEEAIEEEPVERAE